MNKQGEFIKQQRRKIGLTQKQLAAKLNVSDKVISKWEVGDSFPDYSLLMPLANILKVDVQEILNGELKQPEPKTVEPKVQTQKIIYIEKHNESNDNETSSFVNYLKKAFKWLFNYKHLVFIGLFVVSVLAMFCKFLSWGYGNAGFSDNYFKFLFAPFKKDLDSYLYGDYLMMFSYMYTKNTNIVVYIVSGLIWIYLIYLAFTIIKLINSYVKKQNIETDKLFKLAIINAVFSIALVIMSFVLKSRLIAMLQSYNNWYDVLKNSAVVKTASLLPFIWSLVPVIIASVFKYWKIFEDVEDDDEEYEEETDSEEYEEINESLGKFEEIEVEELETENQTQAYENSVKVESLSDINSKIREKFKYDEDVYREDDFDNQTDIANNTLNIVEEIGDASEEIETSSDETNYEIEDEDSDAEYFNNEDEDEEIYNEDEDDEEISSDDSALKRAFRWIFNYRQLVFAGFFIISVLAMFCKFISFPAGMAGFSDNYFKFLFAPLKKEINTYLYGEGFAFFEESTNFIVYLTSGLIWIYLLYLAFTILKLVNAYMKKQSIETQNIFIYSIVNLVFCVALIIMSFILRLKLIDMIEETGIDYDLVYKSQGVGFKIASLLPFIWSLVPAFVAGVLKYWKIFGQASANGYEKNNSNGYAKTSANRYAKNDDEDYEYDDEIEEKSYKYGDRPKVQKKNSLFKIFIVFALIAGICGAVFFMYTSIISTPRNTIKQYLENINDRNFSDNLDLMYGLTYEEKESYLYLQNSYTAYSDLKLKSIKKVVKENNVGVYNVIISGFHAVSGKSILFTYKYDVVLYKDSGKWKFFGIMDIETGTAYNYDKTNKCITQNKELVLYLGNDINSFIIPEGITSVRDSFFDNLKNNRGYYIIYSVSTSNPKTYTSYNDNIYLYPPTKTGYNFIGWRGSGIIGTQESVMISSGSTGNRYYIAVWSPISYTITYEDAGYNSSSNPAYYTIESEVTLKAPTKQGAEFLGWTGSNGKTPQKSVTILKGSTGHKTYKANWHVTSLTIPEGTTTIRDYEFDGYNSIKSLVIPSSVTSIGQYAFRNCSSLTNITIPNSVTSIGYGAFKGCSSLESITLPFVGGSASATTASSNTLFGYIFGTSSYTGGVATDQYYSGNYDYSTYYIPKSLKSVTITGGNILFGAFSRCSNLTSISISSNVKSIGNDAFSGCMGLTNIILSSTIKSIADYAFEYCESLTNITIPSSVTSIGQYAFSDCRSLTNITIPNSVTSIGRNAFSDCRNLTSVTIGNNVTSIGYYAFDNCNNLASVTFRNTSNWVVMMGYNGYGNSLLSSELSNSSTAARYLRSTYYNYNWYRN